MKKKVSMIGRIPFSDSVFTSSIETSDNGDEVHSLVINIPINEDEVEFTTLHKLDFEVAPWEHNVDPENPYFRFRVGTCEGLWGADSDGYSILAVTNSAPNNGHFEDVLQWFEHSCKRDKKNLWILEVWNQKLKKHLIEKRGFMERGKDNVVKTFKTE